MKFYPLVENWMSLPTKLPITAAPLGYRPQSFDTNINADLVRYTPENPMSWNQDPTAIASLFAQILNTANIPYYITGGVAAIAHGEKRATIDLNMVISIDLADLPTLAANFEAQ